MKKTYRHERKHESSTPAPNAYNTSRLNPRGKYKDNIIILEFVEFFSKGSVCIFYRILNFLQLPS